MPRCRTRIADAVPAGLASAVSEKMPCCLNLYARAISCPCIVLAKIKPAHRTNSKR
jgi:hypothetical protein